MVEARNIFPLTIYQSEVNDNPFLKELFLPSIEDSLPYLTIPEDWATDNLKTSYGNQNEILSGKKFSLLEKYYDDCINEFFDKEVEWEFAGRWYNYYREGSYQESHDHLGTAIKPIHFSCIHYLSFDPEVHTSTEFIDPISALRCHTITLDRDFIGDSYSPPVGEGDIIMFPSYLQHRVRQQKISDIPRVTISFNVRVLKYDC